MNGFRAATAALLLVTALAAHAAPGSAAGPTGPPAVPAVRWTSVGCLRDGEKVWRRVSFLSADGEPRGFLESSTNGWAHLEQMLQTPVTPPVCIQMGAHFLILDSEPVIDSGRVLAPVRALVSMLPGVSVTWDDATGTAMLRNCGGPAFHVRPGDPVVLVENQDALVLDVPPRLADGTLLVPVRFLAGVAGAEISWDPDNRVVQVAPAAIPCGAEVRN